MTCPVSDEQLLLSAHGELSVLATLKVASHIVVCPACKTRRAEFLRSAKATAQILRDPAMPTWSGGWLKPATAAAVGMFSALTTFIVVATLAIWFTSASARPVPTAHFVGAGVHPHCTRHLPAPQIGCKPGLPTDKCQ